MTSCICAYIVWCISTKMPCSVTKFLVEILKIPRKLGKSRFEHIRWFSEFISGLRVLHPHPSCKRNVVEGQPLEARQISCRLLNWGHNRKKKHDKLNEDDACHMARLSHTISLGKKTNELIKYNEFVTFFSFLIHPDMLLSHMIPIVWARMKSLKRSWLYPTKIGEFILWTLS